MTETRPALQDVDLPIARYRFTAELQGSLTLPAYSGSLLRGAFGAALRRIACMTGQTACPPCALYRTCPYPALFETPPRPTPLRQQFSQVPNPYVVEPPPPGRRVLTEGEHLTFHMVLVGSEALRQLPLVVQAWRRALAHGLGPQRTPAHLLQVQWVNDNQTTTVLQSNQGHIEEHRPLLRVPSTSRALIRGLTIEAETPLRLQHQGQALGADRLNVRTLALAALRRTTLMLNLHAGWEPEDRAADLLKAVEAVQDDRSQLHWCDWTRYSSRQKQEMTLGGVVGSWHIAGPVTELWPWLWITQWLHMGKNATMGMGKITVKPLHGERSVE